MKGKRLSEDWEPTAAQREWAKNRRPELDVDEQVELFKNYWLDKTGKDATKIAWDRTWCNWIIRSYGPIHKRPAQQVTPSPTREPLRRMTDTERQQNLADHLPGLFKQLGITHS